jgi:hypothetical protein
MAMIKTQMNAPRTGYTNLTSFVADWRLMFANARTYNIDDSPIFTASMTLEKAFDTALYTGTEKYGLQINLDAEQSIDS